MKGSDAGRGYTSTSYPSKPARRVTTVAHLFHPTRPDRRATFAVAGDEVRYTIRGAAGRRQTTLTVGDARRRWAYLRKIGYQTWDELNPARQTQERT